MKYKRKRRGGRRLIIFHCSRAHDPFPVSPLSFLPSFLPSFLHSFLPPYHVHTSSPNLLQLFLCVSRRLVSKVLGRGIPLNLYYRPSYEERTRHGRTRSSWIIQSRPRNLFRRFGRPLFSSVSAAAGHGVRLFARYCAKCSGKHAESSGSRGVAFVGGGGSRKVACVR